MTRAFSWKRGLKHAGLTAGLLVLAGAGVAVAADVADPEKFGEGAARFILFAFAIALAVSYLFQTGRRRAGWTSIGGVIVVVGGVVAAMVIGRAHAREPLSASEKLPMTVETIDGKRWLVHGPLGFRVAHPGASFKDAPRALLDGAFAKDLDAHAHGWLGAQAGRMMLVLVTSQSPRSEKALADMVRGIRKGMSKGLAAAIPGELKTVAEEIRWVDGASTVTTHVTKGTSHLHINAWQVQRGEHRRMVIVFTMSVDDDALATVAGSLTRS